MTTNTPRVGEQRTGGRSARVRSDVLAATSQLLGEVGYDTLTIEEVATRAGVHKTTVYRRWPTKPELVADSVEVLAAERIPIPDTGSLRHDLQLLARQVVAHNGNDRGKRAARSIVAAAAASNDLAANIHAFWSGRMAVSSAIVQRAIGRGEVASDVDPVFVIEALVGPIWLRLLMTGESVDEEFADQLADFVVDGLVGGASSTPATVDDPITMHQEV